MLLRSSLCIVSLLVLSAAVPVEDTRLEQEDAADNVGIGITISFPFSLSLPFSLPHWTHTRTQPWTKPVTETWTSPWTEPGTKTCPGGTITTTYTGTTEVTVTPSVQTTVTTVTETDAPPVITATELSTEFVTSTSTATDTAPQETVTQSTTLTCFSSANTPTPAGTAMPKRNWPQQTTVTKTTTVYKTFCPQSSSLSIPGYPTWTSKSSATSAKTSPTTSSHHVTTSWQPTSKMPASCVTETETQVITQTTTLASSTVTSTTTTTFTPDPTITTVTSTTTQTSVETTTTTVTPSPTTTFASIVSPTGLNYYDYYPETYSSGGNAFTLLPQVISSVSNNPNYNLTGSIRNINVLGSPDGNTVRFPDGQTGPGHEFALIFQGYVYAARGAGTYTISSRSRALDDMGLVWVGDKALANNWNYDNRDYGAEYPIPSANLPASGSVSFNLTEGQAEPATIFWGNSDGPGQADFVIIFGGTTYTDTSDFFVGACSPGTFIP